MVLVSIIITFQDSKVFHLPSCLGPRISQLIPPTTRDYLMLASSTDKLECPVPVDLRFCLILSSAWRFTMPHTCREGPDNLEFALGEEGCEVPSSPADRRDPQTRI